MIRVFLDANILFSAAWCEGTGIGKLWKLPDIQLVTSPYALMEAVHNIQLKRPSAAERLSDLTALVEASAMSVILSEHYALPEKDRPILEAAVGSDCAVLLTGDIAHFGHLIGTETEGVKVMTVSLFLASLVGSQ